MAAYRALLEKDAHLLEVDANERSITHKLAEHLQEQFPDRNVDCEYNRKGFAPKQLPQWRLNRIEADNTDAATVYPDIIVHRRGTDDNLLVIEAKKDSRVEIGDDASKLRAYKSEHQYLYAYAVVFRVHDNSSSADPSTDVGEL